jgi:hypothetical protein
MRMSFYDNPQQAIGFLIQQTTYIEAEVYRIQYPDILYSRFIPIDTSASEWAKSVTYFSLDKVGQARWFNGLATDMAIADVNRAKFEMGVEMAGIGYRYTLEEIGQAQMVPGTNLTAERAEAARRAAEEHIDRVAWMGDAEKQWTGFLNNPYVTRVDAIADGTGGSPLWTTKTADQMIRDVNDAITGVYTGSLTVEMADTVLLPVGAISTLASTRVPNTMANALEYVKLNNIYTLTTGQELTVMGLLALDTAANNGGGRMVAYRRDPRILKMHIPMKHRFLPVWQTGPITFDIPGIFRLAGVEIRRPGGVRYVDGIVGANSP